MRPDMGIEDAASLPATSFAEWATREVGTLADRPADVTSFRPDPTPTERP